MIALLEEVVTRGEAGERDGALEVAAQVLSDHGGDPRALVGLARAMVMSLLDIDDLNRSPPEEPIFEKLATLLRRQTTGTTTGTTGTLDDRVAMAVRVELANLARFLGRKWDPVVEECHAWRLSRTPDDWEAHYDFGLFCKTRGRFAEGQRANQRAAELGGADDEAVRWNLGICATGAKDAATALGRNTGAEHRARPLDRPRWHRCEVLLSERPIAERSADHDDPGAQRRSGLAAQPFRRRAQPPYHDVIGVEFGDVILFRLARRSRTIGRRPNRAVFPALATSRRSDIKVSLSGRRCNQPSAPATNASRRRDLYNLSERCSTSAACLGAHGAHFTRARAGFASASSARRRLWRRRAHRSARRSARCAPPSAFSSRSRRSRRLRDRAAFERRAFDSI